MMQATNPELDVVQILSMLHIALDDDQTATSEQVTECSTRTAPLLCVCMAAPELQTRRMHIPARGGIVTKRPHQLYLKVVRIPCIQTWQPVHHHEPCRMPDVCLWTPVPLCLVLAAPRSLSLHLSQHLPCHTELTPRASGRHPACWPPPWSLAAPPTSCAADAAWLWPSSAPWTWYGFTAASCTCEPAHVWALWMDWAPSQLQGFKV